MNYACGNTGRVFVVRLNDGEAIYPAIESLARKENIAFAQVVALGGMRRGKVVVGPEKTEGPILPIVEAFDDAREIAGIGTIAWDEKGPNLHFHAAIGRGKECLTGCPRLQADAFLVLEVIITEITGVVATRKLDEASGAKLLQVG